MSRALSELAWKIERASSNAWAAELVLPKLALKLAFRVQDRGSGLCPGRPRFPCPPERFLQHALCLFGLPQRHAGAADKTERDGGFATIWPGLRHTGLDRLRRIVERRGVVARGIIVDERGREFCALGRPTHRSRHRSRKAARRAEQTRHGIVVVPGGRRREQLFGAHPAGPGVAAVGKSVRQSTPAAAGWGSPRLRTIRA